MPFETGKYEYHGIGSYIFGLIYNADGSLRDSRMLCASDIFAKNWVAICADSVFLLFVLE